MLDARLMLRCLTLVVTAVSMLACQSVVHRPRAEPVQPLNARQIADVAARAMQEFDVPGMAIGIVQGGATVYAQGHGIRELGFPDPVDEQTLFKIASNTKAFTTAALAMLADEGKLAWDGPVVDYIPEFRLSDPWITAHFTVADLLTHRSGLPRFVGDLMFWPEPNAFTHDDIIHALQFFELESGFRTEYAYDNLLYVVAGQLVPGVTGQSWGEFIDRRIMQALDMQRCFAGSIPEPEFVNLAAPHGMVEDRFMVIERSRIGREPPVSAAAGGVVCSLQDMLTWVKTQLARGVSPSGLRLFSEQQSREMWRPHIWRGVSASETELHGTHFNAYGLGWRLNDAHGFKEVGHTGSLAGMLSSVVMIPELDLGVVILSNGSDSAARSSVMDTIVHSFLPVEQHDWIARTLEERAVQAAVAAESSVAPPPQLPAAELAPPDLAAFAGLYRDPWFGDVLIEQAGPQLFFRSHKSPKLSGPMHHVAPDTFKVQWIDRTVESDAFLRFGRDDATGQMRIWMTREKEFSERSLDFQDLRLVRVE